LVALACVSREPPDGDLFDEVTVNGLEPGVTGGAPGTGGRGATGGAGGEPQASGGSSTPANAGSGGATPAPGAGGTGGGIAGGAAATGGATIGGAATGGATTGGVATGGAAAGGTGGETAGGAATGGAITGGTGGKAAGGNGSGGKAARCDQSNCGANADCDDSNQLCVCRTGFVPEGSGCRRPASCAELHRASPDLPSDSYALVPTATEQLQTYCEMEAEGGGWTLVFNSSDGFDPEVTGNANALCYERNCVNLAYSLIPVGQDVMLDVGDRRIEGNEYRARIVIEGVHAETRGNTVRAMMLNGPFYLEKEDNSNLRVLTEDAERCEELFSDDFQQLICDRCNDDASCSAPVLVFGDGDSSCTERASSFAIGGAESYSTPWSNCAGWPQQIELNDRDYYPSNVRLWIR
jgi:hypothetical protein